MGRGGYFLQPANTVFTLISLGRGQSEFACDCTCSKIYCLDLELQRTVVSPQVGQITNTLVLVPTNFGTGRTLKELCRGAWNGGRPEFLPAEKYAESL